MGARRVLITGTTSGIGRALLEHYLTRGASIIAVNRRREVELESRYPSVRFECVDVCRREAVAELVRALSASGELPEVWILNAGINRVDNDETFALASYQEVVETNLYGALNFVAPLTELPPSPVERHVIAISSMAGHVGNPYGLGYHTSKRALTACFDVWAEMYAGTDLVFQQVMLGPVRTAIYTMADRFPFWMVWLKERCSASLSSTVSAVSQFAESRKPKLFFPWRAVPLYGLMWFGQRVISGLFRGRKTLAGERRRRMR